MKQLLIPLLLVGAAAPALAQSISGKSIPEYTTKLGTTIHQGDTLTFGRGGREDGSFKYATIPPTMMVPKGMAVPADYAGKKVIVKDVRDASARKSLNKTVYIVFKAGLYNAQLDADAAEDSGELLTRASKQKATPAGAPVGVADELLKLKKLLDAGALTQAEYDTQKAKLLSR